MRSSLSRLYASVCVCVCVCVYVCFPLSPSPPFPRLSPFLVYLSYRSASALAPTFSFSRRDKPSANVLDGRCSDGGSATRHCMSLRLCATSTLRSSPRYISFSFSPVTSFSFPLKAHRKSRATLHFTVHAVAAVRTLRHQHLHFARAVRARRRDLSPLVVVAVVSTPSACVCVPVHRVLQLELASLVSRS